MSNSEKPVWPDVYPVLRYKNGSKAMEWLTQVFGFSRHWKCQELLAKSVTPSCPWAMA